MVTVASHAPCAKPPPIASPVRRAPADTRLTLLFILPALVGFVVFHHGRFHQAETCSAGVKLPGSVSSGAVLEPVEAASPIVLFAAKADQQTLQQRGRQR